jgi:hypothetical protein
MDITLYKPDGNVKYPGVENYGLKDGILTFVTNSKPSKEIRTNVPFLIEGKADD